MPKRLIIPPACGEADLTSNDLVVRAYGDRGALDQIKEEHTCSARKFARAGRWINLDHTYPLSRHNIKNEVAAALELSVIRGEHERASEIKFRWVVSRNALAVEHGNHRSVQPSSIAEGPGGGV